MNEEQLRRKQHQYILHILRNPCGWSEDVVREVRLMAADELERLYQVELAARQAAEEFQAASILKKYPKW